MESKLRFETLTEEFAQRIKIRDLELKLRAQTPEEELTKEEQERFQKTLEKIKEINEEIVRIQKEFPCSNKFKDKVFSKYNEYFKIEGETS